MKYLIEFKTHDGRTKRTLPFDSEQTAKFAALAVRLTLMPYSDHDPEVTILAIPTDADLVVKQ